MILAILAESALRSLLLGAVVWIGLNLLRARNPQLHMTSWIVVLAASLSMPLLMHWTTVTVTLQALPVPAPETLWPAATTMLEPFYPSQLPLESVAPAASPAIAVVHHALFNWLALATAVYAIVAAMLLLRIAVGVYLTWRLACAATSVDAPWTEGRRVRVSDRIGGPVTFGSTILLPPHYREWDVRKREAVLAHEGAHVANRDFHVLLLASINRAVFWFSPFAWWQLTHLAELAETISDARAVEVIEDRCSYAEILLDLVQRVRYAPAGLEMARACTVKTRVERILAATAMPANLGWRKRAPMAAAILPLVVASAVSIVYSRPVMSSPEVASAPEQVAEQAAARMPERVAFYSLNRGSIFAISRNGDEMFGQLSGQRRVRLAAAGDGNWSYPAATGQITFAMPDTPKSELTLSQNGKELRVARIADLDWQVAPTNSPEPDAYVGAYELNVSHLLSVTREGNRLFVEESGQPKFEVTALGVDAFSAGNDRLVVFLRNEQGRVNQLLIQEPAFGARLARWIKPERAKVVRDEFARRLAEVPDRFKDQAPQPGGKDALLRGIADMQRGAPNYERMSMALASKVRRQAGEVQAQLNAFGAVESIFFRGVGPGGYDIYGVKFAKGFAEFRTLFGADGKAEDVIFRPDGNEALGGVTACAGEADLKAREDSAPIQLQIYNGSGAELQLFRLDADGKRQARGTISEHTSSPVMTNVGSPWLVADASGKCLEIVLPGQHTRFHAVENRQPGAERAVRTTPQPGSEAMLRQYLKETARGEPDYDRMTAEVAAQTRRALPFNQAILARLGVLRSMSFRGVSAMGSDIYLAYFANGSAEFRIVLVKDCTTIGRIALGPQY